MSYPTVARVVAFVLVLSVFGSTGPVFAGAQVPSWPGSWIEQAPEWLVSAVLKGHHGKPKPRRPGPASPNPGGPGGEEGPGTCPSGIFSDGQHDKPGKC